MSTFSLNENTTRNMVTGFGNGRDSTSRTLDNPFRTPANTRAREDVDISDIYPKSPQGSMTFIQHLKTKIATRPRSRFVDWREELPLQSTTLGLRAAGEAAIGAPAPIVGTSTIRANEIFKLPAKAITLKGSWDKCENVFEFHPNLHSIHTAKSFQLPYPNVMEKQGETISETILHYNVMSEADQLTLDAEDDEEEANAAIVRLSTNTDNETEEQTNARQEKLAEVQKALRVKNKVIKMHKVNKIVCNNIVAYWGCLKIFVSENHSFRHEAQQIPLFDVWTFKDNLFSHFLSDNSVIIDQLFTEFQLMKISPGQDPMSFASAVETKAEKLYDCGYGDIEDQFMKTRVWKGLSSRQTLQDFLFTWIQDKSISYFKFQSAIELRSETTSALVSGNNPNLPSK